MNEAENLSWECSIRGGSQAIVTGRWHDSFASVLSEHSCKDLVLNYAKGWQGSQVGFLADLPWLESLTICDWKIRDVSAVNRLHELRSLRVATLCKTELNFANFPELTDCSITWRRKAKSIFNCTSIECLFIEALPEHDLNALGGFAKLEKLNLMSGSLKSTQGIGRLRALREVRLLNLRNLCDLKDFLALASLSDLEISGCPKIRSIEGLSDAFNLKTLTLDSDGPIESLAPIKGLALLEQVSFAGSSVIVDGDLSPLVKQPPLRALAFANRKHYSHRRKELFNNPYL